jgi:hypothetical protein
VVGDRHGNSGRFLRSLSWHIRDNQLDQFAKLFATGAQYMSSKDSLIAASLSRAAAFPTDKVRAAQTAIMSFHMTVSFAL